MNLKSCAKIVLACLAAAQFGIAHRLCSQTPSEDLSVADFARESGPDLSGYVSPNLDPEEQTIMRLAMNGLPAAMREKIAAQPRDSVSFIVVDGATNTIHYSRPEEVGSYQIVPALNLPGAERPDARLETGENSETAALPETTKDPGPYGGSGPYRRVYTVPVPAATPAPTSDDGPIYAQRGTVTTFCNSGIFAKGGQDRGYLYMGGWSPTWNSVKGSAATSAAVDAGLVYNLDASENSIDDYAMFINLGNKVAIMSKGNGITGVDTDSETTVQPPHILCHTPRNGVPDIASEVNLTFTIIPMLQLYSAAPGCYEGNDKNHTWLGFPDPGCTTFAMVLTASSYNFVGYKNTQHTGFIMWVAPSIGEGGWASLIKIVAQYWNGKFNVPGYIAETTCGGCIFKWMTSIAQSDQNLSDGHAFGAAWLNRGIAGYAWGKNSSHNNGGVYPLTADITDCSEYPLWHTPYPARLNTDCTNTPSGLKGLAQSVQVRDFDTKGEWDIIDLKY